MADKPNFRRMLRTSRLLYELGHTDIIEALGQMKALREVVESAAAADEFCADDGCRARLAAMARAALTATPTAATTPTKEPTP